MLYEFGCIGPTLLDGRFLHLVPDIRLVGRHDDGKDKEDDEAHFIGLHIPTERALKACNSLKAGEPPLARFVRGREVRISRCLFAANVNVVAACLSQKGRRSRQYRRSLCNRTVVNRAPGAKTTEIYVRAWQDQGNGCHKKEPRAGARGCKSLPQLRLLEKAAAGVAAIAAQPSMEFWYLLRSNVMQSTIFHFATRESEQSHTLMFSRQ
jgi:hypothetical protein